MYLRPRLFRLQGRRRFSKLRGLFDRSDRFKWREGLGGVSSRTETVVHARPLTGDYNTRIQL